jgi:Right handed beta helix region
MIMMWMRLVVPILMIMSASPAWATRYWVSTSGNDANSCTSVSGAQDPGVYRLTPQNGAACLRVAGDRLTIKAGTYTGSNATIRELEISVASGTAGNPTIIEGQGSVGCALTSSCLTILKPSTGRAVTLNNASYITLRLLEFDGTNNASPSDAGIWLGYPGTNVLIEDVEVHNYQWSGLHITVDANFTTLRRVNSHNNAALNPPPLQSGPGHGVYVQSQNILIENSSFNNNGFAGSNSYGMHLYLAGASGTDNAIVRNNRARGNSAAGLVIDGSNVQVYNNIFTGNNSGIDTGYGCPTGQKFYNNLLYNNSVAAQIGNSASCGMFADFSNNHIVGNGAGITLYNGASMSGSHNRTTGTVTDCTVSTVNFYQKVGSSCIDAGLTLSIVTTDFVGVVRPQGAAYDIGVYEGTDGPDTLSPSTPIGLMVR